VTKTAVHFTHPDKLYWPDDGYTKADLILFYDRIFDRLQPWVKDRILTLERCPDGMRGDCFFQKEMPDGMPPKTPSVAIQHEKRVTHYVVGGERETQLALVNLGTVSVHVWASRARTPRRPDWVTFDLDPASGKFSDAAKAGLGLRVILDELGLESFPKTSGGKGLHVFVPLEPGPDCNDALQFAQRVSALLVRAHPAELTVEARKSERGKRVYLDSMRNAYAQTVAAPYSVRFRPHAPVSTPLEWSEVAPDLDPADFNIGNFLRVRRRDPWAKFFTKRQGLVRAMQALDALDRELVGTSAPGAPVPRSRELAARLTKGPRVARRSPAVPASRARAAAASKRPARSRATRARPSRPK